MTKTNQKDWEFGLTAAKDTCKAQVVAAAAAATATATKDGSALSTSLAVVALAICATTF